MVTIIFVLIVALILCVIVYQIPFPANLLWLRWTLPCLILLLTLLFIFQYGGLRLR